MGGLNFDLLQKNLSLYMRKGYYYLLWFIYYGSVPSIILYGLFSKPQSPFVAAAWSFITGKEPEYPDMYGHQGGF